MPAKDLELLKATLEEIARCQRCFSCQRSAEVALKRLARLTKNLDSDKTAAVSK